MTSKNACYGLVGVIAFALVGCGGASDRPKVYKVTGKITMSGAPVAGATVTFAPKLPIEKPPQPVAIGITDAEGAYTLQTFNPGDGAVEGNYIVLVTKATAAPAATIGGHDPNKVFDAAAAHAQATAAMSGQAGGLPVKYSSPTQSDLKAKVESGGKNDFPFDLKP